MGRPENDFLHPFFFSPVGYYIHNEIKRLSLLSVEQRQLAEVVALAVLELQASLLVDRNTLSRLDDDDDTLLVSLLFLS